MSRDLFVRLCVFRITQKVTYFGTDLIQHPDPGLLILDLGFLLTICWMAYWRGAVSTKEQLLDAVYLPGSSTVVGRG